MVAGFPENQALRHERQNRRMGAGAWAGRVRGFPGLKSETRGYFQSLPLGANGGGFVGGFVFQ